MGKNGWKYDGLFDWTQSADIILKNKEIAGVLVENNKNEQKIENKEKKSTMKTTKISKTIEIIIITNFLTPYNNEFFL